MSVLPVWCMYVCVPHACLVSEQVRKGCQLPWNWQMVVSQPENQTQIDPALHEGGHPWRCVCPGTLSSHVTRECTATRVLSRVFCGPRAHLTRRNVESSQVLGCTDGLTAHWAAYGGGPRFLYQLALLREWRDMIDHMGDRSQIQVKWKIIKCSFPLSHLQSPLSELS